MTTSQELLNGKACSETLKYDPKTQLPQYPNGADVSTECTDALYEWYVNGQEGLSKFLVVWSPAEWDSIYLANYEKAEPSESLHVLIFTIFVVAFDSTSIQPF